MLIGLFIKSLIFSLGALQQRHAVQVNRVRLLLKGRRCVWVCAWLCTSVAYRRGGFAPDPTWVLLPVCAGVCVCKACIPHCFAVGAQSAGAPTGPEAEQQKIRVFCGKWKKLSLCIYISIVILLWAPQLILFIQNSPVYKSSINSFVNKILTNAQQNFPEPKATSKVKKFIDYKNCWPICFCGSTNHFRANYLWFEVHANNIVTVSWYKWLI